MKKDTRVVAWSYTVELLFVALAYGGIVVFLGEARVIKIIQEHWSVFSATAGGLFAIGFGAIIYFSQILESDFGKYLHWRKADVTYMHAYQVQAALFFSACGAPAILIFSDYALLAHFAWVVYIYACVNAITIVQNTVALIHLKQKFLSEWNPNDDNESGENQRT